MSEKEPKAEEKSKKYDVAHKSLPPLPSPQNWENVWVLRITDIVQPHQRRKYQDDIRVLIKAFTAHPNLQLAHIGSYRVVFGHALEFMHLFAIPNLQTYEDLLDAGKTGTISATYRKKALNKGPCHHLYHIYKVEKHVVDSHWELLKPDILDEAVVPDPEP